MLSTELFQLYIMTKDVKYYIAALKSQRVEKVRAQQLRLERKPFNLSEIDGCEFFFRFSQIDIIYRLVRCIFLKYSNAWHIPTPTLSLTLYFLLDDFNLDESIHPNVQSP